MGRAFSAMGRLAAAALVMGTLGGAVTAVPVAAQDGLAIMRAAAERYQGVEALCADFTQHLVVPLLGDERTGEGRVCQARPNKFAMRFTQPDGDRVVIDGESVWVYYPSLDEKQVMRMPVAQQRGGHDFHREFLEDPETKYDVSYEGTDTVAGRATHRLKLVPRSRASYTAATLWIDEGRPALRRLRIEEENGTVRTITLSNIDFTSDPDGAWFTFTPPEGALIVSG